MDAGEILEHQKQYAEAAAMYIKGEQYERAADMYIKYLIKGDKNKISEAAVIMEKVKNDQLNASFAKACVSCGRYQEAVRAYERANDIDKVRTYFFSFIPSPSIPVFVAPVFIPSPLCLISFLLFIPITLFLSFLNSFFFLSFLFFIQSSLFLFSLSSLSQVVELKLRHLDEVQQAFDLVRGGGSAHGAQLVADYCIEASGLSNQSINQSVIDCNCD